MGISVRKAFLKESTAHTYGYVKESAGIGVEGGEIDHGQVSVQRLADVYSYNVPEQKSRIWAHLSHTVCIRRIGGDIPMRLKT